MGKVPCEFRADRPTFIFQPAAPDMIWHIYLHLYCSSRNGSRDLPSSGKAAPTMGKVPCEFWADWLGCSFSGEELRQGSFQPCPAQDGASSMAGSSWHDLVHLLWAVLLQGGFRYGPAVSGDVALMMGQVPCEFWGDRSTFIFQPVAPDVIWHIYLHLYCSLRDCGRDLPSSGEVAPTMGQVPCEFPADQPNFIFQLAAPDMIWHIYSRQCSFKGDLGMDLLSSGDDALTMGQVPCEFWADQPTFIFQPAAPDVIWHIYSHLHCSSRDGGRDLRSSGKAAPTMGKVPCEFWPDWPGCSFSGEELRQGSSQPCPAQDGASSMASGSGHNLAHLLRPVLLIKGWWQGLAIFRGGSPYQGAAPLWVSSRSAKLPFSAGGSWHDLAHLLWAALLQGGFRYGPAVFRGCCPYNGAGPLWVLSRLAKLHFSASSSWRNSAHLLWAGLKVWTCHLQGMLYSSGGL